MAMSYSYEKLGFTSGQTLKAEHLNHMEDGIANPCWNDMKNKPFGEETVIVNEPLNITWDGNTEGLVSFDFDSPMYKVSDVVFSQEQVKILELCLSNGITQNVAEGAFYFDCCSVWAFTTTRYQVFAVFSEKDNATFAHPGSGETIIVPEAGVYFSYSNSDAPYIELLTSSESIEQTKTVVKKIDEKYLPDSVKGGGASSWNDLKDKPFGSETRMIFSWDGNTDGLEMIDGGDGCYYYKITDEVFMIEEFAGTTVSFPSYGVEAPAEEVVRNSNGFPIFADGLAVIATNTDSIFPSTGIWSSVPISVYVEKISTIPKKYLPSLNHKEVTNAVVPQLTMRQDKTRKVAVDSAIAPDGEFVYRFAYLFVPGDDIPHTELLATSSALGINEQNGTFVLEYDTAIDLRTGVTLTKLRFTFDGQTDDAVLRSITCSYPQSIMLMSNGGKKFNVAVGDNGTLIATEV